MVSYVQQDLSSYEKWLGRQELSENTIKAYMSTAVYYTGHYSFITKPKLKQFKKDLMDSYKPNTVNARIHAINKYLEYSNKKSFMLKTVKQQNQYYLDNVISNAELNKFQKKLKENGQMKYYILIRTLVCTAARISETLRFQVEDVEYGYAEILSKGGKIRRIYFPTALKQEILSWLESENRSTGPLFLNKNGVTLSMRS